MGSTRPESAIKIIIFGSIFALGAGLFLYNFTFFKFATDEPYVVILGDVVRDNNFLVGHAEKSATTSLVGGAFFSYVIGAVTWITSDPRQIMLIFTLFNIGGFLLAIVYMARTMPPLFAVFAAILLVTTPGLIFNANRIWSVTALFPLVAMINVTLYLFIKRRKPHFFAMACGLTVITTLTHLSGVFLLPAMVGLAFIYRDSIGARWLGISVAIALFLSAPYIYFLLIGGGLDEIVNHIAAMGGIKGGQIGLSAPEYFSRYIVHPVYKIFDMTFASSSINYFKYIFGLKDFSSMVEWYAGPLAKPLYWLSLPIGFSFLAGWAAYLVWVARNCTFFSKEIEIKTCYPLPFQISGFLLTSVIAIFLLLRLSAWPHYFQILYPSIAILSAWPMFRLWRFIPMRVFFALVLVSHLTLSITLWSGIKESGGANSYRLTYEAQEQIRDAIWKVTPKGKVPQLFTFTRLFDLAAVYSMVGWENAIGHRPKEPVAVITGWDDYRKKTLWSVKNISQEINQRISLLEKAVKLIPEGATVLAHDSYSADMARRRHEFDNNMPFTTSPKINGWIKATALGAGPTMSVTPFTLLKNRPSISKFAGRNFPVNANGAEYVVLNISDPRKLNPVRNMWDKNALRHMLQNPRYGIWFHKEGVFIFKKDFAKTVDVNFYGEFIFSYPASEAPNQIGRNVLFSVEPHKTVRMADDKKDDPGFMAFGPYLALPEGEYEALFDVRIDEINNSAPIRLDVAGHKGSKILAQKEINESGGGEWQTFKLAFSVGEQGMDNLEFRAFFTGEGAVSLAKIRLKISDKKIEKYINNLKISLPKSTQ